MTQADNTLRGGHFRQENVFCFWYTFGEKIFNFI